MKLRSFLSVVYPYYIGCIIGLTIMWAVYMVAPVPVNSHARQVVATERPLRRPDAGLTSELIPLTVTFETRNEECALYTWSNGIIDHSALSHRALDDKGCFETADIKGQKMRWCLR